MNVYFFTNWVFLKFIFLKYKNNYNNMKDTFIYILLQPVFHDWYNTGCDMCYPSAYERSLERSFATVCSKGVDGSGFPLSFSESSLMHV